MHIKNVFNLARVKFIGMITCIHVYRSVSGKHCACFVSVNGEHPLPGSAQARSVWQASKLNLQAKEHLHGRGHIQLNVTTSLVNSSFLHQPYATNS